MIQLVSIILIAAFVGIDQWIKYIVINNLDMNESAPFIPKIVEFYRDENTGAAFSILDEHTFLLSVFTLVIILVGLYFLLWGKIKDKLLIASAILFLSGGIGNLIDRIFRGDKLFWGSVVDYVKFLFVDFAVFNFADCLICIGAAMIMIYVIVDTIKNPSDKKKGQENG